MSPTRTEHACHQASARELIPNWLDSAIITEQVVDMLDPVKFPEMALARLHAAKLREMGK